MTQENLFPEDQQPDDACADCSNPETLSVEDLLKQQKHEVEDYKDKYLRLLAEMDNTRKRMQKCLLPYFLINRAASCGVM